MFLSSPTHFNETLSSDRMLQLFTEDNRRLLYDRLATYEIFDIGQLESALDVGQLEHLHPDDKHYLRGICNDQNRPVTERVVACSVLGRISFAKDIWQGVVDTPQFQRLRRLRQLGASHYVYPAATHTRFEHSLGVGWLAGCWFDHLLAEHKIQSTKRWMTLRKALVIAGLCHDLGHGPFSHAFEDHVNSLRKPGEEEWHHEDMSRLIFEQMCEESSGLKRMLNRLECEGGITKTDIIMMMSGEKPFLTSDHNWTTEESLRVACYSIVANKDHGFDVDRFDYLNRDAAIDPGFPRVNINRLIECSSTFKGEIVFNAKAQADIAEFFQLRYHMFAKIYFHKNNHAIDLMISDFLRITEPIFGAVDVVKRRDVAAYLKLSDGMVEEWTRCLELVAEKCDTQILQCVQRAGEIVRRLEHRELYAFLGEFQCADEERLQSINVSAIADYCEWLPGMKPDDVNDVIALVDQHHHFGTRHASSPWDTVWLYHRRPSSVYRLDHEARIVYPVKYKRRSVLLFCKFYDHQYWQTLAAAGAALGAATGLLFYPHRSTNRSPRAYVNDRYPRTPPHKGLRGELAAGTPAE